MRNFCDAGAAPSGPEIDHDDLTLEVFDRDGGTIDGVGKLEIERLANRFVLAASPLDHPREVRIREILGDSIVQDRFGALVGCHLGRAIQQSHSTLVLRGELEEFLNAGEIRIPASVGIKLSTMFSRLCPLSFPLFQ
jgi:hypothetical protein